MAQKEDLSHRRARLSVEQQRLLAERLKGRRGPASDASGIPRVRRDQPLPLSYAQQRQWFLWQLEPQSTAYHLCGGLALEGELDADALVHAFDTLVARHESLRTVLRADAEGLAEQVILPEQRVAVDLIDLRHVPIEEQEARAQDAARALTDQPFDLTQGPLLRVGLIQLDERSHRLVVVMHHIVSDGWSMQVIVDEFAACYRALRQGQAPQTLQLPPLAIQYADYAQWQRQWLEAGERERQLAYWRAQLSGGIGGPGDGGSEHPVLALPTDRPRQPQARLRGARHTVQLPPALAEQVRRSAQAQGATVFMLLLTAFHALLHRHTGQRDIRVGVPVANRQRIETEAVVGFFVNTQVLRSRIAPRMTLQALLDQVREAVLGAQAHQDLPFEQLVEALQPERSLGHHPLFQVMANHLRQDRRALQDLPGLQLKDWTLGDQAAQFELTLDTIELPDGRIEATFTYAAELFEAQTIARLARHHQRLLSALCEAPQQAIGDVDLLGDDEQALLRRWSGWQAAIDEGQGTHAAGGTMADITPVHRLIEEQVRRTPEAIALIHDDAQLSYAELNRRANRLAHRLIALGAGPEVRIGLALERSLEMVVALLAVLKSGAAYVPLDPDYPAERLGWMIEDSGLAMVLTQSRLEQRLADASDLALPLLCIDEPEPAAVTWPDHNPQVPSHGEHLAYVIYTSGSTGRPKGIAIPHHALSRHSQIAVGYFRLTAQDRMLLFSTINFDGFVEQLFPPLCVGAGVVLRGPLLWDSDTFHQALHRHRITIADLTTAYWFMLAQDFARQVPRDMAMLRQVQATGEAMPPEGVQAWRDAGLAHVRLLNTYGPTETTVTATMFDCDALVKGLRPLTPQLPIGTPLAGRQMHVLDENLRHQPCGVPGELCIGGALLARGYVRRPGLTAERFIADPFDPSGGRLYRTGDLVRWRPDGQLEYLGRIDHQVKIRGFRIELGEVEASLLAQAGVREAVAVAQTGAAARLLAYVSPEPGMKLSGEALRLAMSQSLPDYMVPSVIMVLDALPLNPNGKIDRHALPPPDASQAEGHEPPQGPQETALAALWARLLGVQRVGRHDNFFALGGHSLMAAQLCAGVSREGLGQLPLSAVFESPTLLALAARLRPQGDDGQDALASSPRPMPIEARTCLSPAQQRLWLVHRLAATGASGHAAYHMAAAWALDGDLVPAHLSAALNAIVARHEVLRTSYVEDSEGEPRACIHAHAPVVVPLVDIEDCDPPTQQRRLRETLSRQADTPFDLGRAPVLRAVLVRLAPRRHVLGLAVHHIAFDGWSEAVFFQAFRSAYEAASQQKPALDALPPLQLQYGDHAAWHTSLLVGPRGHALRAFWKERLRGAPTSSCLPADPPPDSTDIQDLAGRAGTVTSLIDASLAERLGQMARQHEATRFHVLLAAFHLMMHQRMGKQDVVIGTDAAGRDHPALQSLLGFFVNVVPVRTHLAGSETLSDWLHAVRHQAVEALAHADLPFDQILDAASLRRERGRPPLVQILFVMQNVPQASVELPGLVVTPLKQSATHAKFDLAVFVNEAADGLHVEWVHDCARHSAEAITRLASDWTALLSRLSQADARAPLALPDIPTSKTPQDHPMIDQALPKADKLARLNKLKKVGGPPPTGATPERPLVTMRPYSAERPFPLVIEAAVRDVDPIAWARANRDRVESLLLQHAGLLFRGFALPDPQAFEAFAETLEPSLYGAYGDLPKKEGGRNTYRSTPYPEREMILYHNESSHLERWPLKQWFFCELPSRVGGATPIVDGREMLRRLPPALALRFEQLGLRYVRTFTPGLDVSWQDFFKTTDRHEVERRLSADQVAFEWLDDDTLQTHTRCPAVITHPVSGERAFFNQVQLHHVSCLDADVRRDLLQMVGIARMPRHVYWGDGSDIDDGTMALIGELYESCAVRFDWRRGDVVMLDNMLAAHARDPYEEPRKIVVAMGAMMERASLKHPWELAP